MDIKETKPVVAEPTDTSKRSEGEVSKQPGKETSEVKESLPITETPEFTSLVARLAQSEADKRVKVFEQEIRDIKASYAKREQELLEKVEDTKLETLSRKWLEEGEAEEKVVSFRDKAKELIDKIKQHNLADGELKKLQARLQEERNDVAIGQALRKANELNKPLSYKEAEEIVKDSEGNSKLIDFMIRNKSGPPPVDKEAPKRPDTSAPSAPGGGDKTTRKILEDYSNNPRDPEAKAAYMSWLRSKKK